MESAVAKRNEFAPGIPRQKPLSVMPAVDKEKIYEFGVHDHHAAKSGRHYDLRLGDPKTGKAYSWAIPSAKLPAPGSRPVLAIPTFIHKINYMDFEGIIGEGYGKGIVKLPYRGKALVHYSSPTNVKFTVIIDGEPNTFVMFKPKGFKNSYLLSNITKVTKEAQMPQDIPTQQPMLTHPATGFVHESPPLPFSVGFFKRLPTYALVSTGLEMGLGYGGKALAKAYPNMASSFPNLYKFLITRRPSLLMGIIAGATAAAAKGGWDLLKHKFPGRQPYVQSQNIV